MCAYTQPQRVGGWRKRHANNTPRLNLATSILHTGSAREADTETDDGPLNVSAIRHFPRCFKRSTYTDAGADTSSSILSPELLKDYLPTKDGIEGPAWSLTDQPAPAFRELITFDHVSGLVNRYFHGVSPMSWFLHRSTVRSWVLWEFDERARVDRLQSTIILIICAHVIQCDPEPAGERQTPEVEREQAGAAMYEEAKATLAGIEEHSLIKIQATICMCLYHLSSSQPEEALRWFDTATAGVVALGLRQFPGHSSASAVDIECQKRVLWSLYILDALLSAMLGSPRMERGQDEQTILLPSILGFNDPLSVGTPTAQPVHTELEVLFAQIQTALLLGRAHDSMDNLPHTPEAERLELTSKILNSIDVFESGLSSLCIYQMSETLVPSSARPIVMMKLNFAHARILATRRYISTTLQSPGWPTIMWRKTQVVFWHAVQSVLCIIETVIDGGQPDPLSWYTQHVALVAFAAFYAPYALRHDIIKVDKAVEPTFRRIRRCSQHLTSSMPHNSEARRNFDMLAKLSSQVARRYSISEDSISAPSSGPDSIPRIR